MKTKVKFLTIAVTGLMSSVSLMDMTSNASASSRTIRNMCEMRCSGVAICLQECGQEQAVIQAKRRRTIIIPIPRDEPEVAKNWISGIFNPTTGGGGGGGGGGGNGR